MSTRRHLLLAASAAAFAPLALRAQGAYKGVRLRHAASDYLTLPFAMARQEKMKRGAAKRTR